MKKIAVFFYRIGPYHYARLKAAAAQNKIIAVEYTTEDPVYAWDKVVGAEGFERVVLFPGERIEGKPASQVYARVHAALDKIRPDVVALPGWNNRPALAGLKWCDLRRVPAVVMSETTEWDASRLKVKEAIKRYVVKQYATALVGGEAHRSYLVKLGMHHSRIFLGYDAVDNSYFHTAAQAALLRERPPYLPARYLLASARFVPVKNLETLLRAFARFKAAPNGLQSSVKLVVLGDGPLRTTLEELRSVLGLQNDIVFPGFKQYDELPTFYAFAEAFVHASKLEPWGLVVNEAMAAGLAVVVSRTCGCASELVQEGRNGFIFDPEDVNHLSELIHRVVGEGFPRRQFGDESQKRVQAFGTSAFADGLDRAATAALSASRLGGGFLYHPSLSEVGKWFLSEKSDQETVNSAPRLRVFRVGGRPVIAWPDDASRVGAVGLERFRTSTRRRALFLTFMRGARVLGLEQAISKRVNGDDTVSLGINYSRWVRFLRGLLGEPHATCVLAWPPQPERRRYYMHVFNAAGVPIAFVKIVTPAADWGRLETDHTMLTSLQSEPDLGFLTPRAISRGDYDGSCYSVQQPLPVGSESPRWGLKFRPSEILAKWTGSFDEVSTLRLSTYSWWDRYLSRLDENVVDFHQELVAKLNDSRAVRVGRVHGDFSASNVAFVKGTPWIFDWECAAIDAPFLTDDIGLFLSFRVGRVARNPQPHIDEFVRYFEKQLYLQRLDVMLAMAYRHACGFPDTPVYLSRWRKISKYV